MGKQTLYFFPDKVLVFEKDCVGAVSYENLNIQIQEAKFIEDNGVPSDTTVIDHTWKYVNKKVGQISASKTINRFQLFSTKRFIFLVILD